MQTMIPIYVRSKYYEVAVKIANEDEISTARVFERGLALLELFKAGKIATVEDLPKAAPANYEEYAEEFLVK